MNRLNPFKNKIAAWALWVCWCFMILKFSSDPGTVSGAKSGLILEKIVALLTTLGLNNLNQDWIHFLIRKAAHTINYLCLGLVAFNALRFEKNLPLLKTLGLAFVMTFSFAACDEVFQTFIPGRSGQVRDVLIDGTGASIGLIGVWVLGLRGNGKSKK